MRRIILWVLVGEVLGFGVLSACLLMAHWRVHEVELLLVMSIGVITYLNCRHWWIVLKGLYRWAKRQSSSPGSGGT